MTKTPDADAISALPQRPLFLALASVSLSELLAMRVPGINERVDIFFPEHQRKSLLAEMLSLLQSLPWRTSAGREQDDRKLLDDLDALVTDVIAQPAIHKHPLADLEERLATLLELSTISRGVSPSL